MSDNPRDTVLSVPVTERSGDAIETVTSSRREAGGLTPPLRSAETFEAYCTQVQTRLIEHAQQRRYFLQEANERLTRLLQTARAVEDVTLYEELWQLRQATRELLDSLQRMTPSDSPSAAVSADSPLFHPREEAGHDRWERNGFSPFPNERSEHVIRSLALSAQPAPRRLSRHPLRPLATIEADAIQQRATLAEWSAQAPLRSEDGAFLLGNCLRLRAFACRHRRLEAEAGETEVAEVTALEQDVTRLFEAADDREYTLALDDTLEPVPTAYQWGELAERYDEMAVAQEAFVWWQQNEAELTPTEAQPLAEAIAAVQQRFNRLLFRVGARDPFQQQLFDALRTWAREAQCYLYSLRPKVPIAELIERAGTLTAAWERGREILAARTVREAAEIETS